MEKVLSELDVNRLLLQFEKSVREINREVINPRIEELRLSDLNPVVQMVASARACYLKELFDMANVSAGEVPRPEQIKRLKLLREAYEELVEGSIALETAIERGYLDVSA
ncbi:MAG: hypothetical protein KZQ83_01305 [gamma proteobacterium symbiont of Taylorina sp.]|nr:hypothetical protein [gamma proteobacterium symbiont of Taylorina sp.]